MTDDPKQAQPPSPERVMAMLNGYQQSAILKGAIDLGLFTAIGGGEATAAELARRCAGDLRGITALCDALTVHGLLEKRRAGYRLAADSLLFLDQASPAYLGGITEFQVTPEFVQPWWDIAGLVRAGGPAGEANVSPENPIWVKFATGMAAMMAPAAKALARLVAGGGAARRILDIAAGHGLYGIEMAALSPQALVTAQDWPLVLEVARRNADAAGLSERWSGLPGSAFDVPFGTGYDCVLLTNFLQLFDAETCTCLLRKAHAALAPGGRAVTLGFVPDEDGVSPRVPALFGMVMFVSTPKGRAYRYSELKAMHREAGFASCELHDLPGSPARVVVGYR